MFYGTLGMWKNPVVNLDLKDDATPMCQCPYPVPRVHEAMLRMEVERLVELGVIEEANNSEWGAPSFTQPKPKTNSVILFSDFWNLNMQLKHNPYPMPKISEMLLTFQGFQYATTLDLKIGYYHIRLSDQASNLCTIILPQGNYKYKRLPMGICNSPDIFQEKMNEMDCGFEFIRSYIYDLSIITKGDWSDHLNKLEQVLKNLKENSLKCNIKRYFFGQTHM